MAAEPSDCVTAAGRDVVHHSVRHLHLQVERPVPVLDTTLTTDACSDTYADFQARLTASDDVGGYYQPSGPEHVLPGRHGPGHADERYVQNTASLDEHRAGVNQVACGDLGQPAATK